MNCDAIIIKQIQCQMISIWIIKINEIEALDNSQNAMQNEIFFAKVISNFFCQKGIISEKYKVVRFSF